MTLRNKLSTILQATFVLPFTAGSVKDRRNVGYSLHDGSIAGIVFLATAVIFIFETILVITNRHSQMLIFALSCIATFCLLILSILAKSHPNWTRRRSLKPADKVKLKFLWFFVVGNIVFQCLNIILREVCNIDHMVIVTYFISTWIFQIFQTIFIHHFSKFKFAKVLSLYYGLLILFVTNISIWTQQRVYTYRKETYIKPNTSFTPNITMGTCSEKEWIVKIVFFLEPFMEPFLLEYSLLSLIFLSEMWPKKSKGRLSDHFEDLTETKENNENDPLLQLSGGPNDHSSGPWNKTSISVALLSTAYTLSFSVLECLYIYVPDTESDQFSTFLYILFFSANLVRIPVLIKCFYGMSNQLRPKVDKDRNITLNQVIIILSSVATCGYSFLQISRSSIYLTSLFWMNAVVRNIDTILQTLFILQMKYYKKKGPQTHFCSVQNTFLFNSMINFGVWISYTFVNPKFLSLKHKTHVIFLNRLWFPFVIFYHFESFIAFYGFFRGKTNLNERYELL